MGTILSLIRLGLVGQSHAEGSNVIAVVGGQLSNRAASLRAEVLELFEEANQAEERELSAVYRVTQFKHSLKVGGKFGKVKPVFYRPTVTGFELRAVHADLKTLSLRKRGRASHEIRKLTRYRKLKR